MPYSVNCTVTKLKVYNFNKTHKDKMSEQFENNYTQSMQDWSNNAIGQITPLIFCNDNQINDESILTIRCSKCPNYHDVWSA